jgi:hypothetical protein
MTGARIFVAVAFVILGASFLASTGLLIREFQGLDWPSMILAHSHLFLFFPVFGLLALFAFYLPSVVFTDLYWHHLPYGKLRFFGGLVVVAALSFGVSKWLDAKPRAIWEASPGALLADRGEPAGCGAGGSVACRRTPVLTALGNLRATGQTRIGLSKFARNCAVDSLLELPEEMEKERYCFAADAKIKGAACCEAQQRFADEVARLQADPSTLSLSGRYDAIFLPVKTFFVLIVVAIGLLLAVWRNRLDRHYGRLVPSLERGVIVGALAMLLWPAMDYGYQQTANVLFGRWGSGPQLRLSLVIAPWALLLLFYFLRRLGKQGEMIGQTAGVVTAGVAVLRYEDLNDWAVRLLGIGSGRWIVMVLFVVALAGFLVLLLSRRWNPIDYSTPSS